MSVDNVAEKYPGLQQYRVCQSKAFVQGIMGCGVGASAGFAGSILYHSKFPGASKHTAVVLSIACGVATGYIIASVATQRCRDMWVDIASEIQRVPSSEDTFSNSFKPSSQNKVNDLRQALELGLDFKVQKNDYEDS
ncbi:transmembrane protein 141-like [Anneissia japonica]|uniref:transmembrane protein 141-like n=1 Tax=Anneissia japonica TaxID=1529436 RepID=UPI001425A682|nr:transmembrane protein 141-like [Anneissia japonica]